MKVKRLAAGVFVCLFLAGCSPSPAKEPEGLVFSATNERGNTNGNIANLSLAAQQGDWVLFCDMADEGRLKATRDGGKSCMELMASFDDTYACLNLVGERLYYISSVYSDVNAVLLDNETAVNVWAGHSYCMQFFDGAVWFIDESGDGFIKRLDPETGETERYGAHPAFLEGITDASRHASFSLDGGYLYYAPADQNGICRVRVTDKTEETISEAAVGMLTVTQGRIYYTDTREGGRLFRLFNGQVDALTQGRVGTFNAEGSVVWYTDASVAGSPVMRLENGGAVKVCDKENTLYLSRLDGMLMLYCQKDDTGETWFVTDDGNCISPQ